eukprot:CAMPEP_0203924268 /NCGR_PEP_ID=MMETSP0359-20131031/64040_1 /ASSEMBLY_ACC=CAM_ASM_000338 /TAXON_ID=268821 /ORGANISM="Scrippsiella Hangoei, Strain SHTV-5" /LENGTH=286 /DNA_ID=CAMNT_0050852475 /DNA_START=53 /DNA_END=913 /DNA_ORIENTATION=-
MAMEAASVADARRLYEYGFEGWDIEQASYLTNYVIMAIGIALAFLTYDVMKGSALSPWSLLSQFGLFALLEGVGYGFGGVSHHILDTYYEQGSSMSYRMGQPQSEWMFAWMMALITIPFASASCAGTAFAYAGFSSAWTKLTKGVALAVSLFELYLAISNKVMQSGTVSLYFAAFTSAVAICVVFARGKDEAGQLQVFLGNVSRLIGFAITVLAPRSCRMAGDARQGCPYAAEFNHNAIYHCFIAASLVLCYLGVMAKDKKEKELDYLRMARNEQNPSQRGCLGCG